MISLKTISRAVLALTAAAAAQGAMAANANVVLNAALMAANGLTPVALGLDTYNAATGNLTAPILTPAVVTPLTTMLDFGVNDGFKLQTTLLGSLTFNNFSFYRTTNTLNGSLKGTGGFASATFHPITTTNQATELGGALLKASTVTVVGDLVTVSNFTYADELRQSLIDNELNPDSLQVGDLISTFSFVQAVPEPSTYALMGLGLVGIAFTARKRRAA